MEYLFLVVFLLGGIVYRIGSNKLSKLAFELFPEREQSGFRPSRKTLKLIEHEHRDNQAVIHRLKQGRTLELIGYLILLCFLIAFIYVYS